MAQTPDLVFNGDRWEGEKIKATLFQDVAAEVILV
jgi:hypothetical protein